MSVYLRGSVFWCKFQVQGHKINETTRERTKQAAERYERMRRAQVEEDIRRERFGLDPRRTFEEALLEWLKAGAPESMKSHTKNARPYMEGVLLQDSVKAALKMKQAMLARGLNPQTVNRRLAVVRAVLNFSYKQLEWIRDPLGPRISAMMLSEKEFAREHFLTERQVSALLSHIDNDEVKKLVLGYCYTGARRSELLGLDPTAFDGESIRLSPKTKGKKGRTIPIPEHAREVFKSLPFQCTVHELRGSFERARKAAGMPWLRLHDLRHTYASWLIKDPSIPMTLVRDILGHSSLSVTSRYTHLRPDVDAVKNLPVLGTKVGTSGK